MNCTCEYPEEFEDMMQIERAPRVLYQYTVRRTTTGDNSVSIIIGDDCIVQEGTLMIFREQQMVAAFQCSRWLEVTGEAILPKKASGRYPGSTARECEDDYCEE
jgi:hypothetical protein